MKIGIVDADLLDKGTRFPNLAAMKISGHWKRRGADARLCLDFADACECDKLFVSKVFTATQTPKWLGLLADRCEFGGTGFNLYDAPPLPDEVERGRPDYDLYRPFVESFGPKPPSWLDMYTKASVGFTTRGCFRKCPFCVNKNRNRSIRWDRVENFLDLSRPYVILLDDNVFGCKDWAEIFDELAATGKRFAYRQGLDIRLVSRRKAAVLERAKYWKEIMFAFDNIADERAFRRGAENFRAECSKTSRAYVLTGFYKRGVDELSDVFKRLAVLAEYRIYPYLMRHENYKLDPFAPVFVDLARWCNQQRFFKATTFAEFAETYGSRKTRELLQSRDLQPLRATFEADFLTFPDEGKGQTMENPFYALVMRSGSRESLYLALWLELGEAPGLARSLTISKLVALCARYGATLTEPQVRARLKSLVDDGLVERDDRDERGVFDLFVYAPFPTIRERAPRKRPTPLLDLLENADESRSEFCNEIGNETGNEVRNETGSAAQVTGKQTVNALSATAKEPRFETASLEENNINKNIINKTNNQPEVFCCEEVAKRPATNDVRRRVDFADPRVAALRAKIVERVWEPTLHADLVDRLTAAVVLRLGGFDWRAASALIAEAKADRALYDETRGTRFQRGSREIWRGLGLRVKRIFENAGWVWTPTRFVDEPEPKRANPTIKPVASRPEPVDEAPRTLDELLAAADGFEPETLKLDLDAFAKRVARKCGIADACQARCRALEIRAALRELQKHAVATA